MKVLINSDRTIEIFNQTTTQNETNVEIIDFEFPEIYKNWNKKIVFILPISTDNIVWDLIENNRYILKSNVTQYDHVEFYVWLTHEEQDFRSETKTLYFNKNINANGEITPEEEGAINKILAELDAALQEVDNVDIDVVKQSNIATITISKKDGTSKSANILDGEKGEQGEPGYTPQKGVDYWTTNDKQEIISELQEYINQPFATFEIVDGNLMVEVKEWQV